MKHFRDSDEYNLSLEDMHESVIKHFRSPSQESAAAKGDMMSKGTSEYVHNGKEWREIENDLTVSEQIAEAVKPLQDRLEKLESRLPDRRVFELTDYRKPERRKQPLRED